MKKFGWILMLGLSGLAVSCTGSSKGAKPKEGSGDEERVEKRGGRWGGPGKRRGRGPKRLLRLLDTDRDGVISKEELAQAGKSLSKLDKNGDGQLTPDELRPKWRRGRWGMRGGRRWGMRGGRGWGMRGGRGWGMGGGRRWGMGGGRGWGMGGGPDCPGGMGGPDCPGQPPRSAPTKPMK